MQAPPAWAPGAFVYLLPQTSPRLERDDGNLFVLEGVLMGLILLGAAYAVGSLQGSSLEAVRPQHELERLVGDALTVLDGLEDNGTSLLDLYFAEALHCARDAVRSTYACDGTRSRNLSLKLDSYLPVGAGYAVGLGNGGAVREIYRSPLPQGEALSTSRSIGLEWNLTFVVSDLDCYEAGTPVDLTLFPIDRGNLTWARWGNVTLGASEVAGQASHTPRWWDLKRAWNVTYPYAPPAGPGNVTTVVANVTANATLPGATSYRSCALGGAGPALHAAIEATPFSASAIRVPVAGSVTFVTDLAAIAPHATILGANVTIYEPAPPRGEEPDTWLVSGVVPLVGAGTSRSGTWEVPSDALYGLHPAVLRVHAMVGTTNVELRRAILVGVTLPDLPLELCREEVAGEDVLCMPEDPPYRATLQAWLPDWG